ncbi:hypothetical protein [Yoonia sp. 208BN28-4]|uniref:hypothetical protein n=1 Tax=Yoonia sp. 208BN28-4 TaxID=3126505 RepID=UPI0030B565E9
MMKTVAATAMIALLAACQGTGDRAAVVAEQFVWDATQDVNRFYADTFQDAPFDSGPVSVLTEEHGELHTYTLTPCRAGTRVCGTRAGHLSRNADFYILTGAYHGRTFYFSPGGDGFVKRGSHYIPMAWN